MPPKASSRLSSSPPFRNGIPSASGYAPVFSGCFLKPCPPKSRAPRPPVTDTVRSSFAVADRQRAFGQIERSDLPERDRSPRKRGDVDPVEIGKPRPSGQRQTDGDVVRLSVRVAELAYLKPGDGGGGTDVAVRFRKKSRRASPPYCG